MLQTSNTPYSNYLQLQQSFNEDYKCINKQILALYQLPKKFIEQNEKNIKEFVKQKSQQNIPHHVELSVCGLRDFAFELEDFKLQTMQLFFEHRGYIDRCTAHMMKLSELKQKSGSFDSSECTVDYLELIPELNGMSIGLKDIWLKARSMAVRLQKIKIRWERIKQVAV